MRSEEGRGFLDLGHLCTVEYGVETLTERICIHKFIYIAYLTIKKSTAQADWLKLHALDLKTITLS